MSDVIWDVKDAIETGFRAIEVVKGKVVTAERSEPKVTQWGRERVTVTIKLESPEVLVADVPVDEIRFDDDTFTLYIPYSPEARFFWVKCFIPAAKALDINGFDDMIGKDMVFARRTLPLGELAQTSYVPVAVDGKRSKTTDAYKLKSGKTVGEVLDAGGDGEEEFDAEAAVLNLANGKTKQQLLQAIMLDSKLRKLPIVNEVRKDWVDRMVKEGKLTVNKGVLKVS